MGHARAFLGLLLLVFACILDGHVGCFRLDVAFMREFEVRCVILVHPSQEVKLRDISWMLGLIY